MLICYQFLHLGYCLVPYLKVASKRTRRPCSIEENDDIAEAQEIFCGRRPSPPCTEILYRSHCVLL